MFPMTGSTFGDLAKDWLLERADVTTPNQRLNEAGIIARLGQQEIAGQQLATIPIGAIKPGHWIPIFRKRPVYFGDPWRTLKAISDAVRETFGVSLTAADVTRVVPLGPET
jgi:hypothetical protein